MPTTTWPPERQAQLADALTAYADALFQAGHGDDEIELIVSAAHAQLEVRFATTPPSGAQLDEALRALTQRRGASREPEPQAQGLAVWAMGLACAGLLAATLSTLFNQQGPTALGDALGVAFMLSELGAMVLGAASRDTALGRAALALGASALALVTILLLVMAT